MEKSRKLTNTGHQEISIFCSKAPRRSGLNIILLAFTISAGFMLLVQSPKPYAIQLQQSHRQSLLQNKQIQDQPQTRATLHNSNIEARWAQLSNILQNLPKTSRAQRIGLLNFNAMEIHRWNQISAAAEISAIRLPRASSNIIWETLYPEWIDEEEKMRVPKCPHLPDPEVLEGIEFDLIAAKLPCHNAPGGSSSRDVEFLHLQLAAAKVISSTYGSGTVEWMHVLLLSNCSPYPNLFRLKDLVAKEGSAWLYRANVKALKEKLQLPIGSCRLAVPLKSANNGIILLTETEHSNNSRREAYATVLHSAPEYICGAIVMAHSIRQTGSAHDLVVLVDSSIDGKYRDALASAGWILHMIDRIRNPKLKGHAYNEFNYSKLRLWQLTAYDKLIFLDADVLVLRNIDFLFAYPEITAAANSRRLFNSGVMVVEPSNATFGFMMDRIDEIESYNGGDQGFLNEVFPWWHRMPRGLNFLKYFREGRRKDAEALLAGAFVVHYLGMKPWWCYRDYDCNWNMEASWRKFASDAANDYWWKIHDSLPWELRKFCSLRTKQKAALERDRMEAEKANYTDGHWRWEVKDGRKNLCMETECNWMGILKRWGEDRKAAEDH